MAVSHLALAAVLAFQAQGERVVTPVPSELPAPTRDPLAIDAEADPILNLARGSVSSADFLPLVRQAVERHPQIEEAVAGISEAEAARDEAEAGYLPRIQTSIAGQQTIAREFNTEGLANIIERSRPARRIDFSASLEQTVFDWGATSARITAAGARLRAASLEAEAVADNVALRAIAAWYDVFAYRSLVMLGSAFSENQQELRNAVQIRIDQGVSAPGDLPRVESYIASSTTDIARFRRLAANAEARFEEFFGTAPPPNLARAPALGLAPVSKEMAQLLARATAPVESAEAIARAARQDARAQRAQTLPNVTAGIDAGKFGIEDIDYDVRGRLTVTQRFLGGAGARVNQAEARAEGSSARALRVRSEAERDAAVAWADVQALEEQLAALESSYIASRQSRDVLAERFRVARGTLFDLLETESAYFNVAATYIRTVTELDAARYILLSRTGRLLDTLAIEPPTLERP
jgi:adhesin transport system outer membrane protein